MEKFWKYIGGWNLMLWSKYAFLVMVVELFIHVTYDLGESHVYSVRTIFWLDQIMAFKVVDW